MTTGNRRLRDQQAWKVLGWALDLLVLVVIGVLAWEAQQLYHIQSKLGEYSSFQARCIVSLNNLQDNQKEIVKELTEINKWRSATDASRFTIIDGIEVTKELAALKEYVAKIPLQYPSWLLVKVEDNTEAINKLRDRHNAHVERHVP